jgi:hypothetical protein
MNKFLAFLTLSILIASCKKQEIKDPPIGNNPVFKAFGSIGNSNLQIVAGDNDYKMETGFYYLNGIENYFGSLNNTENQLKIVFKDGFLNQTLIQAIHSGVTICSYPNYNEITLSKSDMPNG